MKFDVLIAMGLLAFLLNVVYRRGKNRKEMDEKTGNLYR